jgi:hypothetical protein
MLQFAMSSGEKTPQNHWFFWFSYKEHKASDSKMNKMNEI